MITFPVLAEVGFLMGLVAVVWFISAVVLVLVILIQKGKGGGLGGLLGGGAGDILGTKTGDFLTWVTVALVGLFLVLSVVLAKFYKPRVSNVDENVPQQQSAPASTTDDTDSQTN